MNHRASRAKCHAGAGRLERRVRRLCGLTEHGLARRAGRVQGYFILPVNALTPPGTGRQAGARTTWLFGAALGAGPAFAVRFKSEFRTRTSRLASL